MRLYIQIDVHEANMGIDLHKVFIDDETYTYGHGKAYEFYGVDPQKGAIVIVRPDQCQSSMILFTCPQLT